ncbi:hypothetical protein WR25_08688 [Diploscapter pachys]|uniref:BtpA family membrane complex biogenesis protein n=1 Tax=Diploscapter pachys TaxID=2018661 RepID=A0A2A2LBA0_9BILA|nr:hypothetical protein WR25_08688 [Diploscapter pachys]
MVRSECFVFSHVADEGWMDANAGELLRFRKKIGADQVAVITDVKKKHSAHSVTSDLTIGDIAHAAEFFLADGIVVTGKSTGKEVSMTDFEDVCSSTSLPVFIGSGVTHSNVGAFKSAAGLIVGSEFKKDGKWQNDLDEARIQRFVEALRKISK